jgi:hypothetical protein
MENEEIKEESIEEEITIVNRYVYPGDTYIFLFLSNGKVVNEHRFLMEQHLGRKLDQKEFVHHKDGNKKNNSLENLEVIGHSQHTKLHMDQNPAETKELICQECGKKFLRPTRVIRDNNKKGSFNTFCSKKCSAKQNPPPIYKGKQTHFCTIAGCSNKYHAKGMCNNHYECWRRANSKK